jgi:hypothetical protein
MTLLAKLGGMLMCRDLPKHLNTTTSALRLSPPAAKLISNKQLLSSSTIDLRYAARCRTVLLDAVSCSAQVVGAMTMGRQGLQRLASSPARPRIALQAMDTVQETHMCVVKALKANCLR